MSAPHSPLAGLFICTAIVTVFLTGNAAGQAIPTFDDAPSMEQLRSIMVPESRPGAGRTIVMQPLPRDAMPSPVQRAAVETPAAAPPVAETRGSPSAAPAKIAAVIPATVSHAAAANSSRASSDHENSGVVGFHIKFGFDSATLPESAFTMIDRIAQLMRESPQLKLRVEGHTDGIGSADYNMSLSERRALSVIDYLHNKGIDASRLVPVGKGMTEPTDHNPNDPGNRRVQFVRLT